MKFRPIRVSGLIQKELSEIINREIEFEPGVLVTVSLVEVDKKLERAVVNVSVIPSSKFEPAVKKLEKSRGYLYHLLFKKLNIKPMPNIMFRADHGLENAARVESGLLNDSKLVGKSDQHTRQTKMF